MKILLIGFSLLLIAFGTNCTSVSMLRNNENVSQIELTPLISKITLTIKNIEKPNDLIILRDILLSNLKFRKYNRFTYRKERRIRWKRTAHEIFEDGYVYDKKACTDLTISYMALCKAKGLEVQFVKVYKKNQIHSLAEIKLLDSWYIFDLGSYTAIPVKGQITKDTGFSGWKLWRKGRDSWDIGLSEFNDMKKMCEVLDCNY